MHRTRFCLPLSKGSGPVSREEAISVGFSHSDRAHLSQAGLTSSLSSVQCTGTAEARAAAANRDSRGARASSRWGHTPTPGPSAVPRRARGGAERRGPISLHLLHLTADRSYTASYRVSIRMLKHERGLLSPGQTLPTDPDIPKAGQKEANAEVTFDLTSPHQFHTERFRSAKLLPPHANTNGRVTLTLQ